MTLRKRTNFTRLMLRLFSSSFLAIAAFSLGGCRNDSSEPLEIERTILTDGVTVEAVGHQGVQWQVITMDPAKAVPSLRHTGDSGKPLRDFSAFHEHARASNEATLWMMNAGMYHADGSPVGLCVCEGREVSPVNRDEGQGNFFLKPNGVFYFTAQGAGIIETSEWPIENLPPVDGATQSGPLLVQHGQLQFTQQTDSKWRWRASRRPFVFCHLNRPGFFPRHGDLFERSAPLPGCPLP